MASDLNPKIRRAFKTNLQKFDMYGFVNDCVKEYFVNNIESFKEKHNLHYTPIIFGTNIITPMTTKQKKCNASMRNEVNRKCTISTIPLKIEHDCSYSYKEIVSTEIYYDEIIVVLTSALVERNDIFNENMFRELCNIPREEFSRWFFETVNNVVKYIYDRISDKLFSLLNLDRQFYSMQMSKVYDPEQLRYITNKWAANNYVDSIINDVVNNAFAIYEPFIDICSTSNKCTEYVNFWSGDMLATTREPFTRHGFMMFPLRNTNVACGQSIYDRKKGEYVEFGYFSDTAHDKLSPFVYNNELVSESVDFSKVIPYGYFPSRITIGNLINCLNITFTDKETKELFIIAYNECGTKCRILHSSNSIRQVQIYKHNNIKSIVDEKLYDEYKGNCKKLRWFNRAYARHMYEFERAFSVEMYKKLYANNVVEKYMQKIRQTIQLPYCGILCRVGNVDDCTKFDHKKERYEFKTLPKITFHLAFMEYSRVISDISYGDMSYSKNSDIVKCIDGNGNVDRASLLELLKCTTLGQAGIDAMADFYTNIIHPTFMNVIHTMTDDLYKKSYPTGNESVLTHGFFVPYTDEEYLRYFARPMFELRMRNKEILREFKNARAKLYNNKSLIGKDIDFDTTATELRYYTNCINIKNKLLYEIN